MKLAILGLDGLDARHASDCFPIDITRIDSYTTDDEPFTRQAWPSIYCGGGYEVHGVDNAYWRENGIVDFTDLPPTIFDDISVAGLDMASFRMPITYPARPVNGWMLSGFPRGRGNEFKADEAYNLDPDRLPDEYSRYSAGSLTGDIERYADAEQDLQELVAELADDPDVLFYGTQIADQAGHTFFRADDAGDFFASDEAERAYGACFGLINFIQEAFDPDRLLVVSDHGFKRHENGHSMDAVVYDSHNPAPDIESILDVRGYICEVLGIEQATDKYAPTDRELGQEAAAAIEDQLEDLGYL